MPKRKTTYRVDSTEVQGEGSWIELTYLTHGEVQASLKAKGGDDQELLQRHIVAWNWVDSEGKPLGDPKDHTDDMLVSERGFVLGALFNPSGAVAVKN